MARAASTHARARALRVRFVERMLFSTRIMDAHTRTRTGEMQRDVKFLEITIFSRCRAFSLGISPRITLSARLCVLGLSENRSISCPWARDARRPGGVSTGECARRGPVGPRERTRYAPERAERAQIGARSAPEKILRPFTHVWRAKRFAKSAGKTQELYFQ